MQQHALFLLGALTACTTHNRISGGGTLGTASNSAGGELTAEAATGSNGTLFVIGATGRGGHGVSGAALRVGAEIERAPHNFGARATATIGPAFFDRDGDIKARFEARGSIAIVQGVGRERTTSERGETKDKTTTVGVELFVSSIGVSDHTTLIGIGLTLGRHTVDTGGSIAASRKARRAKAIAAE